MSETSELRHKSQAPRDRLFKLYEASLRISGSLDLNSVLRGVVESARALTGAGSGSIATVDAVGQFRDLVTSGLAPVEPQPILDLPRGPEMWEYLSQIREPIRLRDLSAYLRVLGFPGNRMLARTFLAAPIRHRGAHLGNLYLSDKDAGEEFTSEDEEVLALFASHAGAAIANARKYRDEQRARSGLERLVETSPIGVAVFDVKTGKVVSINQEAQRIVGTLHMPGRSLDELLEAMRPRRADGRKIEPKESSLLEEWLPQAPTVRAEEIVFQGPDGSRVSGLVNATAIRSEGGEVESLVITLQDMTPLEELERLRAEFLGMVSHELQVPLVSIKGCTATAMGAETVRDPTQSQLLFRIIDEQADHMRALISDLLDAARIETGTLSVTPEPADVAVMVEQAWKAFRTGGRVNPVRIDVPPDLPRVLADRQRIVQVLGNLLTNAARHSPEASSIRLSAAREGDQVAVSVADVGRGIPAERLPHVFRKFARGGGKDRRRRGGFGLGLAICKGLVEAHGGRIRAESEGEGLGARFTFTLPVAAEADLGTAWGPTRQRRREPQPTRVLAVDDDPQMLGYVQRILQEAGYDTWTTGDPEEVAGLIEEGEPNLVLLDLMLQGTDGFELMRSLPALADRPVIFLSVYGRDETIAKALDLGATDYLVKPFSPTELLARIRSALRRAQTPRSYRSRDLAIHYEERRVTLAGQPVELSATEFDLLCELSANAGRVLKHDELLRRVWRSRNKGDVRVLHTYVRRLRRKLGEDASNPVYIFTEHRVGYRMPRPGDC